MWSAVRCGPIPGWSSNASVRWAKSCSSTARPTRSRAQTVQPVGWCLDTWSLGADGVVPWQTVGNAESWNQADELSLFYPARERLDDHHCRARANSVDPAQGLSPRPAGRRVPDALVATKNEPRWAVGQQVRAALKLAGTRQGTGFTGGEDAGRIDYGRLRPRDLWAMRVAIGERSPRPTLRHKSKLVDFRTPRREPERLPSAYLGVSADLPIK